jgi:peptide-methionine (S)-S-oxide reductase
VGGQYRSVIYYTTEAQRKIVSDFIKKATTAKLFKAKIVTEVKPLTRFYPAEDYHQDYFAKNPDQAYCQAVINPKLEKFRAKFEAFLKAN